MGAPIELPMAIADCGLDQASLTAQLQRYRALGGRAVVQRPSALELTAEFAADPDPELLRVTIETERECCSFFALDYAPDDRRLTVSIADAGRVSALDLIASALTADAPPPGRESEHQS
jgi:hypothetical protein